MKERVTPGPVIDEQPPVDKPRSLGFSFRSLLAATFVAVLGAIAANAGYALVAAVAVIGTLALLIFDRPPQFDAAADFLWSRSWRLFAKALSGALLGLGCVVAASYYWHGVLSPPSFAYPAMLVGAVVGLLAPKLMTAVLLAALALAIAWGVYAAQSSI